MSAGTVPPVREPDLDLVVLGGGGHVGLPLALSFADAGKRVGIFDINQATLDRIAAGEMPFKETGADDLLTKVLPWGQLVMSPEPSVMQRPSAVIVVIGTPSMSSSA